MATRACRRGRDRGSATVEVVLWAPWLFLLALVGVQAVTYGWAYLAARHAADAAVQTARLDGGTALAGREQAEQILAQAAAGSLEDPQVAVTRQARTATATVTGTPARVIPLIALPPVQVSVTAPLEAYLVDEASPS